MKNQTIIISAIIAGVAIIGGSIAFTSVGFGPTMSENPLAISNTELNQMSQYVMVDIRDTESYQNGHVSGSAIDHLEGSTLEKRVKTIQGRIPDVAESTKIILIDDDGSKSSITAAAMNESGLQTYYLDGGIKNWNDKLVAKQTQPTITSDELYSQIQNNEDIYLLDVRQPDELQVTMISGSVNIPLAQVFEPGQVSEIPNDKPVVVICGSGNRATIATYELAQYGIDFQVLEGGIKSWDAYLNENQLDKI